MTQPKQPTETSYLIPARTLPPLELQPTVQAWNDFIISAKTAEAWLISKVLCAVAHETSARTIYSDVWKEYQSNHDGSLLCYGLCHVLEELIETVNAWQHVHAHLQERFPVQEDETLKSHLEASQQNLLRVSGLNLIIQHEIETVASAHHVLLRIGVLEQDQGKDKETHDE
jgi:hypothetical protein